jgi:hypothetical protein
MIRVSNGDYKTTIEIQFGCDIQSQFIIELYKANGIPLLNFETGRYGIINNTDRYSYEIEVSTLRRVDLFYSEEEKENKYHEGVYCKLLIGFFNMNSDNWTEKRTIAYQDPILITGQQRAQERKDPNLFFSKPEIKVYAEESESENRGAFNYSGEMQEAITNIQTFFQQIGKICTINKIR